MNCPKCGTPEKARIKVCGECGETYAEEDLLELRQLEYLIEQTENWDVSESSRAPYAEQLQKLRERLKS